MPVAAVRATRSAISAAAQLRPAGLRKSAGDLSASSLELGEASLLRARREPIITARDPVLEAAEACPAVAISMIDDTTGDTIFPGKGENRLRVFGHRERRV
jgi:hypothetical protein